ncbi:MAG: ATP-dependent zinc metalloprotease FtsH [Planctomycetes bacterium]|nr:ATP-dependent zinc metalloprotease FtsH [Planctomycetota bacterium]
MFGILFLLFGVLFLVAVASRDDFGVGPAASGELDLGTYEALLKRNEIEEISFVDMHATIVLRPGNLQGDAKPLTRTLNFPSQELATFEYERARNLLSPDENLRPITTKVLIDHGNTFLYQLVLWFLPSLLLIGVLYFLFFRQMRGPGAPGSLMNFGKSKHRVASEGTGVTLKDVAGIDEARQDIEEIIAFLKNPQKFVRLGGRIPKGVLLVGPPGTGKTLLAKATAGEAGVPFFSVSGSDFVEMFVGVGASRVRDLFEKAKENSPCIVFLDEVDAVGRRRGSGLGGGHDEREQTLNQILVAMDGFDTDRGIIVMAATNRADILDPALTRPGRFDRQIVIGLPDVEGREKILNVHARGKPLAADVDLRTLARATVTFSGAELEALLNEAALMAAMQDRDQIFMVDLEEARDKVRWGRQKRSQKMAEEELTATAYHEAGHAVVAALVDGCDPLHKVTIVPRGMALGLTMSLPEQDVRSLTKKQILARIAMAYGGRIGEEVYTKDLSTGASNDIQQASEMIRRMVTEWGMSDSMGVLKYGSPPDQDALFLGRDLARNQPISQATLEAIDEEVRKISDEQFQRAYSTIHDHMDGLLAVAQALLRYETLNGVEVASLLAGNALDREAPAPTLFSDPPTPAVTPIRDEAGARAEAEEAPESEPVGPIVITEPEKPPVPANEGPEPTGALTRTEEPERRGVGGTPAADSPGAEGGGA